MIQNRQINLPQTPKPMSQNQSRRIVRQETTKEAQQQIIQLQDNKIFMSQLCQPMIIHSHRIVSSNKQFTLESPKLKRCCLNLDNQQNMIKQQHFFKKSGQVQQPQKESKPQTSFSRIQRKYKLLTCFLDQKQNESTQNNKIFKHFQSMADLTGWQINEDPQIEMQ